MAQLPSREHFGKQKIHHQTQEIEVIPFILPGLGKIKIDCMHIHRN